MVLCYERGELQRYFELNSRIHEALIAAARNPVLVKVYEGLASRLQRARYLANMDAAHWAEAVSEHEQMLDALAARDGRQLAGILQAHLRNKLQVVCESDLVSTVEPDAPRRASG